MIAGLLVVLAVLVVGPVTSTVRPVRGSSGRSRRETTQVADVAAELAALLQAGAHPARAWELATTQPAMSAGPGADQDLRRAAEGMQSGASPVPLLRDSVDPGVRALGAAWWVGEHAGAPLGVVLTTVAAAIRDGEDAERARQAAMAGPVTTARILSALPLLGLAIGQAIGARPVQTLFGTGYGRVCAVVGLICAVTGLVWTSRLIRSARVVG